jgi:hypothetical protein
VAFAEVARLSVEPPDVLTVGLELGCAPVASPDDFDPDGFDPDGFDDEFETTLPPPQADKLTANAKSAITSAPCERNFFITASILLE